MSYSAIYKIHNLTVSVTENQTIESLISKLKAICQEPFGNWGPVTLIEQVAVDKVRIHLDTYDSFNWRDTPSWKSIENLNGIIYSMGEDGENFVQCFGEYKNRMPPDDYEYIKYYFPENTEIEKLRSEMEVESKWKLANLKTMILRKLSDISDNYTSPSNSSEIKQMLSTQNQESNTKASDILALIRCKTSDTNTKQLVELLKKCPTDAGDLTHCYSVYIRSKTPETENVVIPDYHKQLIQFHLDSQINDLTDQIKEIQKMKATLG